MKPLGVTFNFRRNCRPSLVAWDLRTAWLAAIKYEMVASKSVGSPALRQVWVAVIPEGEEGACAEIRRDGDGMRRDEAEQDETGRDEKRQE